MTDRPGRVYTSSKPLIIPPWENVRPAIIRPTLCLYPCLAPATSLLCSARSRSVRRHHQSCARHVGEKPQPVGRQTIDAREQAFLDQHPHPHARGPAARRRQGGGPLPPPSGRARSPRTSWARKWHHHARPKPRGSAQGFLRSERGFARLVACRRAGPEKTRCYRRQCVR